MMRCATLSSLFALLVLPLALSAADDKSDKSKDDSGKKKQHFLHATISKVNADDHTIVVDTTNRDGDQETKTLKLADDAKILNSEGKKAKLDSFEKGDEIAYLQQDGKVTELHEQAEATITKVDAKNGTVTVRMTDENGKQTEKTFRLVEESEYIDSAGNIALLDVFRSGDMVLFVEADGKIQCMKKADEKTASKEKKSTKKQ